MIVIIYVLLKLRFMLWFCLNRFSSEIEIILMIHTLFLPLIWWSLAPAALLLWSPAVHHSGEAYDHALIICLCFLFRA